MRDDHGHERTRGSAREDEGFGDGQGTRVGKSDRATGSDSRSVGAGSEAAEGMHAADGRDEASRTSLDDRETGRTGDGERDRSASEPLTGRTHEHQSSYGGAGGEPRESSNKRVGETSRDAEAGEGTGKDKDAVGG
jgi:hypothetical protein